MATPEEMRATMIANLPANTGRSLDEWIAVVRDAGVEKHGEIVKLLKSQGVSHGYANLIAHVTRGNVSAGGAAKGDGDGPSDLVESQYTGREDLRPLYERIVAEVEGFGDDVELAPKKAYVSLRRSKQFGLVQPSSKTRIDVGIKSKELEAGGRLESAGSWNSMVTHRVRVGSADEVDAELIGWLRQAYEEA